jgi:hypothetical protein
VGLVFGHLEAPVAAVLALNGSRGEQGMNALRLIVGVVVGIGAAELTVATLGGGARSLALTTFAAAAVTHAMGGAARPHDHVARR